MRLSKKRAVSKVGYKQPRIGDYMFYLTDWFMLLVVFYLRIGWFLSSLLIQHYNELLAPIEEDFDVR